mmetsp:Transcript_80580/g.222925  ORF Transcript_80580/g.222925 Transcript_80580/m.222925 type:complete len:236 (-) Transcript_80580:83-790(-)
MHGMRKQDQREATLRAFRDGRVSALVATDVLGRGVDIPKVSHVVIFDFPDDIETYVHRVGRTGRNGQPGTSVAFFEPQHWTPHLASELAQVLRACGQEVPPALRIEEELAVAAWSQRTWPSAPEAEGADAPPLASAEELGPWDAGGLRVWSYSANGGLSEQGRLEFRSGGRLRTTWGWGDWQLIDDRMAITWSGITDTVSLDSTGTDFELVFRNGRPAHTFKKKTLGRALPGGEF